MRSVDPGAWVEPMEIEAIFDPKLDPDPVKGLWVGWMDKCMPVLKDPAGEVFLEVNAAQGIRKWTVSDCLSMPGVAALFGYYGYKPENSFPPETRPAVGTRLDEVKDYVLEWPGDAGRHPRLFITKSELDALWKRQDADPALLAELLKGGTLPPGAAVRYTPDSGTDLALGAYLLGGGTPEVAAKTGMLARLRQSLVYDLWGYQFGAAGAPAPILYDALIDTSVVPDAEKPILRAQMAAYGYRLCDPAVWSAERGYASGNQNMTVTWEISRGLMACAIPDHPMAKTWYRKAERIMEYFLNHMVGPAGEWPEAMGGHGRTSVNMILAFAMASTNSGLHDYVNDPRLKRLVMYWAKLEDTARSAPRGAAPAPRPIAATSPSMGRDGIGGPGGTCGYMARMTRKTDPAYASDMQWAWLEEGASCSSWDHLGGFSYVGCDKQLPSKLPAWTSEVFPDAGAVLRHGLGTPDEHQVTLYSGDHFAAFYPNHTGSFASIFAYGVPVAGAWPGGYEDQESFLTCNVGLAQGRGTIEERTAIAGYAGTPQITNMWNWPNTEQTARWGEHGGLGNVSSFSALPRQDYAAVDVALHYPRRMALNWKTDLPEWPPVPAKGKPPVDWRRQTLFLKDDDPAQPAYLLIRDSLKGGQPTMWQMWTVTEKIGTPEEAKDLTAFLADKPGYKILPARELKGDRFTAIGQLGVDLEYYIASPTDTPRHTLRWGEDMFNWASKLMQPEYQDLLHLQLPGDGAYFVAFYPRKRAWAAPVFSTLGDGTIIKVSGDFGTDYGFLSALDATAAGEGISFRGTAGSVEDRRTGLVLSLGAKGEVRYKTYGLSGEFPVSLRAAERALTVELPAGLQPPAFGIVAALPRGDGHPDRIRQLGPGEAAAGGEAHEDRGGDRPDRSSRNSGGRLGQERRIVRAGRGHAWRRRLTAKMAEATAMRVLAVPYVTGGVFVDGRLDEGAWAHTLATEGLLDITALLEHQYHVIAGDPQGFLPAPEPGAAQPATRVLLCHDGANLYLGFRCTEPHPEQMLRRDRPLGPAAKREDCVYVWLDPTLNHLTPEACEYVVNAAGQKCETLAGRVGTDYLSLMAWEGRVTSDEDGWRAELVVPLERLGLAGDQVSSELAEGGILIGLNVGRGWHGDQQIHALLPPDGSFLPGWGYGVLLPGGACEVGDAGLGRIATARQAVHERREGKRLRSCPAGVVREPGDHTDANARLGLSVWGPDHQPTLSVGRSDVYDRRWYGNEGPAVTRQEVIEAAESGDPARLDELRHRASGDQYAAYQQFPGPQTGRPDPLAAPRGRCCRLADRGLERRGRCDQPRLLAPRRPAAASPLRPQAPAPGCGRGSAGGPGGRDLAPPPVPPPGRPAAPTPARLRLRG